MVLVFFAVYFIAIRERRQRFEVTIALVIFIKYVAIMVLAILMRNWIDIPDQLLIVWGAIIEASGPIANWTYASQYIKTCILIPGLVSKAKLLF